MAGTFLTAFYTDTVGIAAAAVGTMMLLARILDGITDLMMGAIVDKTKSKYGKARPWVLRSAPFMCVGLILLFTVPSGLGSGGKLAYAYATYIFMNCLVYTANNLPYSSICTNPSYAARYPFQPPRGFRPAAIALNCGAYHIDVSKNDLTAALIGDLLPEKGSPEELELIDVLRHITGAYPPTFFMTCTEDFLKDQAPLLAAVLQAEDVPYICRYYGDKEDRLPHVFHCNIRLEDAKLCNDEECEFFRKYL